MGILICHCTGLEMSPGKGKKTTLKLDVEDEKKNIEKPIPTPADPGCNPLQYPTPSQNQEQYEKHVRPAYNNYIGPTIQYADIIVPRGGENNIALNLITKHVRAQLAKKGFKSRSTLAQASISNEPHSLPESLKILPQRPQVTGLHTIIRDKNTKRDEFIFYSKRLIRLIIEYSLSFMSFKDVTVETSQCIQYEGKRCETNKMCGVSILRAGETMEQALSDTCKDIEIGKILI